MRGGEFIGHSENFAGSSRFAIKTWSIPGSEVAWSQAGVAVEAPCDYDECQEGEEKIASCQGGVIELFFQLSRAVLGGVGKAAHVYGDGMLAQGAKETSALRVLVYRSEKESCQDKYQI